MASIESLVGTWVLVGTVSITDELPEVQAPHDFWFSQPEIAQIDSIKPESGLELTIDKSGQFTETRIGSPNVYWFHEEGYLSDEVEPFSRIIKYDGDNSYLFPSSVRLDFNKNDNRLRVDGDMEISERLDFIDGKLIRTVNVVTDAMYLDRVIMRYERKE